MERECVEIVIYYYNSQESVVDGSLTIMNGWGEHKIIITASVSHLMVHAVRCSVKAGDDE